ncbi:Agc/pkg protein kinase, partial [Globisporangium splendens]
MGAGAPTSPRPPMDNETEVALFTVMSREYAQMNQEELTDEIMFERMKHARTECSFGACLILIAKNARWFTRKDCVLDSNNHCLVLCVLLLSDISSDAGVVPKRPSEYKTTECANMLKKALQAVLFTGSTDEELDKVLLVMKRLVASPDDCVIKQSDTGDQFYVIQNGTLEVIVNSVVVGYLHAGDHFGELALIYDVPRAATVRAATNSVLWTLDRDEFGMIQARSSSDSIVKRAKWLRQVEILGSLSERQLALLAGVLQAVTFQDGETIIRQGDVGDTFYIVEEGIVSCRIEGPPSSHNRDLSGGNEITSFGPGDYFGEIALLSDMPRNASIFTKGAVKCLSLGRQEFDSMLGPLTDVLDRNIPSLDPGLASSLRCCPMSPATQRISMPGNGLRKYCTVTLDDIHVMGVLGEGSFGKVVMVSTTVEGNDRPMALKIMAKSHIVESDQQIQVMREKQALMTLPTHPFIVELYGTYQASAGVSGVRACSETTSQVFLCDSNPCQDQNSLHMLMELVQGGELFTLLHNGEFIETVDESSVRFYSANAVLGLQHMHRYDYAYRDLKPENLLISKEGYLKFVDFGFAKKIPFTVVNSEGIEELHSRTYTLCGTLEYLAPESVLNTGHDLAVDYWALGILIYEMLVGYTPFGTGDGDTTQLFRNIAMVRTGANAVDFPFHLLENCPHACDLVRRLLQGDPAKRIGVGINGDQDVRQHPWFSRIEWDKLYAMALEPLYLPPLNGKYDISLFEGEIGNRAKDKPFDGKGDEFFVGF